MNFEEASYPAQVVDDYTHTRVCTYMCSQMHNTMGGNTKQLLIKMIYYQKVYTTYSKGGHNTTPSPLKYLVSTSTAPQ